MRLLELTISRMPGIDRPFTLSPFAPGMNVILGPNGIGKSRVCEAVKGLLWLEAADGGRGFEASARLEHEGRELRVTRDGPNLRWQADGETASALPVPDEHLRDCFFLGLRALLMSAEHAGQDLAAQVRRQMSGGFDLDEAGADFAKPLGLQFTRAAQKAMKDADGVVGRLEAEQRQLEAEGAKLGELEQRKREIDDARGRLIHFKHALELQDSRRNDAELAAQLDAHGGPLEALDGREFERSEELRAPIAKLQASLRQVALQIERAEQQRDVTRLTQELPATQLAAWATRADELAQAETRHAHAEREQLALESRVAQARLSAGLPEGATPQAATSRPSLEDAEALFDFLARSQRCDAQLAELEERLSALAPSAPAAEEEQRLDQLRRAEHALRQWLSAPTQLLASAPSSRGPLFLAALLVLAGGVLSVTLAPSWRLVGGLVAGAGLGLLLAELRRRGNASAASPTHGDPQQLAQSSYPRGLEGPSTWSRDEITELLHRWEAEVARLGSTLARATERETARHEAEARRETLRAERSRLDAQAAALSEQIGLTTSASDADLVQRARALDHLREAELELASARRQAQELGDRSDTTLKELGEFLSRFGEDLPNDVAAGQAGLRALQSRQRAFLDAQRELAERHREAEQQRGDLSALEAERRSLFERAGLEADDSARLATLMEKWAARQQLVRQREALAATILRDERLLDEAGESRLAEQSAEELTAEHERLEALLAQASELESRLQELKIRIANARQETTLEQALSEREERRLELREKRDAVLTAKAGSFLLDLVRDEHEKEQMPPVLERAQQHFATFTQQRYELRVSGEQSGSFRAIDSSSGEPLEPQQLSDGTRVQLLLAARLAFAEEAEAGTQLPLFLDEALDHSDPQRFHAIAVSLAQMSASEGRQIFYLTNDPSDVGRLAAAFREVDGQELTTHDLGQLRRDTASFDAGALDVPALPAIPSPQGADFDSYAQALQATPFEPKRGARAQHLAHLSWPDVDTLHALANARLETVGQWLQLAAARAPLAEALRAEGDTGAQLDDRAALLDAFCSTWQRGRGRPVGRDALEASGAISETYLESVVEIATEGSGDAARLIETLRAKQDERLKRQQKRQVDDLEAYLHEHGYLDPLPPLPEEALRVELLATPAAARLPRALVPELIRRWWGLAKR